MQRDGDAPAGGAQHGDGAGLGGAHDGADVVLAEDALHRHVLGPVFVEPLLDAALDGDEAVAQFGVGGGAHDADAEHGERPPRNALDDADAAAGQPRVHPQYAHLPPLPFFAAEPPPLSRTWPTTIGVAQLSVAVHGMVITDTCQAIGCH